MEFLDFITIGTLSAITLAVIYLFVIAFYGILLFQRREKINHSFDKTILILIPAHNEEKIIENVFKSLMANDYPKEKIDILVIADNCTDHTAEIARSLGAKVLERFNETDRGKGHALIYAIEQSDLRYYDLVIIIDADNYVEMDFLSTAAGYIDLGYHVVQFFSGFLAADKTAYAYLQYLSNLVENHLYLYPRSKLGLYGTLKGSGMVIKSNIFNKLTWQSESIVEDFDQTIRFAENRIHVYNSMATKVYENATRYFSQGFDQRIRGSSGVFQIIKLYFFKLIINSIKKRDFRLTEFAISFLLLSRPLLIYITTIAILIGSLRTNSVFIIGWGVVLIFLLVFYLFLGIFLSPAKGPLVKAILLSPVFGIWLFIIQILSFFGYKKNQWSRTERIIDE